MDTLSKVPTLKDLRESFKEIEALIFDMDGTLLNSEVLHAQALFELLKEKEVKVDAHELLEKFKGVAEPDVLKMLIDMKIIEQGTDLISFIDVKNTYFEKSLESEEIKAKMIFPEMIQLLEEAKSQGLKLAIVTASERSTTELFMKRLELAHHFDFIITRDDTEKSKPHPMPYLYSFEKLSVNALNSLIFEDSDTGHKAATASGANVVRVSWYE